MPLPYASPQVKNAPRRSLPRKVIIFLALLSFAISATLCVRAMRWDRWANYENNHRPWFDGFGGESYSSFKAWRACRACWERSLEAAIVSSLAIVAVVILSARTWRRDGCSKSLLACAILHLILLGYFVYRWGPDFGHPAASWGG